MERRNSYTIDFLFSFLIMCLAFFFLLGNKSTQYGASTVQRIECLKYEQSIKDVIVWDIEYDKKLEDCIVSEFSYLPEKITKSWLSEDSAIVVCPDERGYLDKKIKDIKNSYVADDYTVAFNSILGYPNGSIFKSHIYILGNYTSIKGSLLHELGHYIYYKHFGLNGTYVLPNYVRDCKKLCANKSSEYFRDESEYFAEIFAYTMHNGTKDFYMDTYEIEKIINNF